MPRRPGLGSSPSTLACRCENVVDDAQGCDQRCAMRRLLFSIVILLCGFQAAALADPLTAPSFWKNQRGSELMITAVSSSGAIRGTFTNHAAGLGCQGIPYPVTGRTTAPQ